LKGKLAFSNHGNLFTVSHGIHTVMQNAVFDAICLPSDASLINLKL